MAWVGGLGRGNGLIDQVLALLSLQGFLCDFGYEIWQNHIATTPKGRMYTVYTKCTLFTFISINKLLVATATLHMLKFCHFNLFHAFSISKNCC